jgi:mono/diheme cytochrome c family protein
VAVAVVVLLFFGWLAYLLRLGTRQGGEKLPANIKPYLTDEELEERKVVRTGVLGLFTAVALAVIMALYWIFIPRIEASFSDKYRNESVARGKVYFATTAEGGFNCAGCHGAGFGGKLENFVLPSGPNKGQKVTWECPALNDVYYRFTREEVKQILIFGRPGTPMPAWGLAGGGPLTDQQLEDLLNYIKSIEVAPEEAQRRTGNGTGQDKILDAKGLFLKNCARCHTPNYSIIARNGQPVSDDERAALPQGRGAYGPPLTNEANQFPNEKDQIDFIMKGSTANKVYGTRGVGNGRMPGFSQDPNHPLLDENQIMMIAEYERGLATPGGALTPTVEASPTAPPATATPAGTPTAASPSPSPSG